MTEQQTKHRICPICEATCGLTIEIDGRTVGDIRGNPDDVFSAGYICPKGVALRELDADPDRLRTPLVRRGGELVETSWEEAFAEIRKRLGPILAEHGRSSVATYLGNPSAHKAALQLYLPVFLKALASKNLYSASTLDQMPKQVANALMYGNFLTCAVPDIDRTDLLVVLGANPMASNGSLWTVPDFRGRVRKLKARGGRLIVVDPKKSQTAKLADQHIAIRPGTDAYLLAAIANTVLAEGLDELGTLSDLVNGLDDVKSAVAPYTPEHVEGITQIPADLIKDLARDIAKAEASAVYGRMGTSTQEFGTLASWLVDVVNILSGNLDCPGGVMFPKAAALQANSTGAPGQGHGTRIGRWQSRVRKAPEFLGEFPAVCLAEEIETPGTEQIRALVTIAGNPILSAPNGDRLSRAFGSLDFMVSVDIYLNETSRHADVILPGTSPLEEAHFDIGFNQFSVRNAARFSPAIFPLDGERPGEWEILLQLAAIVSGQDIALSDYDDQIIRGRIKSLTQKEGSLLFERDEEEIFHALSGKGPDRQIDLALRVGPYGDGFGADPDGLTLQKLIDCPDGVDLGELQPRMPEALRTPTGKIEMAPPEILSDLPRLKQGLTKKKTPDFLLIGRRDVRTNNSWLHNLPLLAKGPFRCTMQIHPEDADRLGLEEGAMASVRGKNGAVEVVTERTDDMMPGVVCIPHGFGHNQQGANLRVASERPGVNSNLLADDSFFDPLSGNAILNGIPVSVSAA